MQCSSFLRLVKGDIPRARMALSRLYGTQAVGVTEERRQAWVAVARHFLARWGDREVSAFRAPARIALNPHCEHQGAWVPYGTHRREIICLAAPRTDDVLTLSNLDPSHTSPLSFRLHGEVAVAPEAWRRGWAEYIEDPAVVRRREALADPKERRHARTGSLNFLKAAALRLMMEAAAPLPGADLVVAGDIPVGAGQSSSSALVVTAALALARLWNLDFEPSHMTALCGEAEWYVGTRGGAGDHAAMLLGSADALLGIRFVPPVTVRETRPLCLPSGYQILIANSSHKAIKNKEERVLFNAGIFAYRFALLYLREAVAARRRELGLAVAADEIRFLADVNVHRFSLSTIYELLLAVPETVSPHELLRRYPESYASSALACFGTDDGDELPVHIPIRGAALYGLGRVDRGLAMHDLCARGDEAALVEFGRLMYATHDGDRISRFCLRQGRSTPFLENRQSVSDAHIAALAAASADGLRGEAAEAVQLRRQPGYYGASTPELDRIVDIAASLPDVLGAGLMGAGGGGCVLLLARGGEEAQARITAALARHYYEPLEKAVDVERWEPAGAAGEVDFLMAKAPRPLSASDFSWSGNRRVA